MVVAIVSWPGLARSSTTLPPPAPPVVNGRHKAGHDTMGTPACYSDADWGGRPDVQAVARTWDLSPPCRSTAGTSAVCSHGSPPAKAAATGSDNPTPQPSP